MRAKADAWKSLEEAVHVVLALFTAAVSSRCSASEPCRSKQPLLELGHKSMITFPLAALAALAGTAVLSFLRVCVRQASQPSHRRTSGPTMTCSKAFLPAPHVAASV